MEAEYRNPDQLLRAIRAEEKDRTKGRLKIFFGYAAGVGKTYAMLEAAHVAKAKGVDVICGYIEPHTRPETSVLLQGLPMLPEKTVQHGSITLKEFDLDAAIARKPQLILVDELAHTNAQGCRHAKRYQDVKELLEAGIDVYSTVNVQHIESLNDQVAAITGIFVRERIPDSVFDQADQVELVDIEPQDLLDRMYAGRIYKESQAKWAVSNFFTADNLTALREIALRRCADRVNLLAESARIRKKGDYHTDEHILVCLSAAPSNPRIIRTAARMASAFRGSFTALYVETPGSGELVGENKKRLRDNISLAQQLGATVETVYGDDVPYQIAEFARLAGVSKIVIGRSAATRTSIFRKPSLTDKVIQYAPNLDVHVIPDAAAADAQYRHTHREKKRFTFAPQDAAKLLGLWVTATVIGLLFQQWGMKDTNIVSVYTLSILLSAVVTSHPVYSLTATFVSVLSFNFFFTEPKFTFTMADAGYPITLVIMFVVGIISSSLAVRLKNNARQSAQAAYRTKILLGTNQLLQQAQGREEIAAGTARQLVKLLNRDVVVYLAKREQLEDAMTFTVSGEPIPEEVISENEKAVAGWVLKNNRRAGASTNTLANARCLYLAIRAGSRVYGVVGIALGGEELDAFENGILLSILGESALALENENNAREKEEAAILARNEQLRANLLRAISHDLRTPLTSISGNASNLISNIDNFDRQTMLQLFTDVYDDSMWLINLVENLLSVTRLEEGHLQLHLHTELLEDIIAEALHHLNRKAEDHTIRVELSDDLLLVKADAKLTVQLVINLVDNAIKYTQSGSQICISAEPEEKMVHIRVADDGPGIADDRKEKVFDMFYSGANRVADSRRSLGLGLSLCRSIVTAHGGRIWITDNYPQGTCFHFTLPAGEVDIHE